MASNVIVWRWYEPEAGTGITDIRIKRSDIPIVEEVIEFLQDLGDNGDTLPYPELAKRWDSEQERTYTRVGLKAVLREIADNSRYNETDDAWEYYGQKCPHLEGI